MTRSDGNCSRSPSATNLRARGAGWFVAGMLVGGAVMWAVLLTILPTPQPRPQPRLDPLSTPITDYPWTALPEPSFPMPPYAHHLKGVTVVLDPGHIGQRDPGGPE